MRIPPEVLSAMWNTLEAAHHDENAGVPIGARSMAFAILAVFDDEDLNAAKLALGPVEQLPAEWADQHCRNPVRMRLAQRR